MVVDWTEFHHVDITVIERKYSKRIIEIAKSFKNSVEYNLFDEFAGMGIYS